MNNPAILDVLLNRLTKQRIPHAENLLNKATAGKLFNEFDLHFLITAMEELQKTQYLYKNKPEYRKIYAKTAALYVKIAETLNSATANT